MRSRRFNVDIMSLLDHISSYRPRYAPMPKVNLYVPEDLKARMDDTGEAVNWSAVAQRAFREAISTHQIQQGRSDMEHVIERLRASKERYEDRQLAAGKEAGSKWAK